MSARPGKLGRITASGVLAPLGVGALVLAVFGAWARRLPVLYDLDSYYHLAIARLYGTAGIVDALPWARFSVLSDGFGDKELLFHVLLMPFADGLSTSGGRWALAVLAALTAGVLAFLGQRAVGRIGLLAPVLVYLGSQAFLLRAVRLRPELLALPLFLLAAYLAAARRDRWLGVVVFVFTLSYTAFHALVGLCVLWACQEAWTRGRWRWAAVLYPVLGAGLALMLHPHFPHNLLVWKIQSLDFFAGKALLDVGEEIEPATAVTMVRTNIAWLVGLVVLWWGRRRPGTATSSHELSTTRHAEVFGLAAAVFVVLWILMARFVIYAIPFGLVAILFAIASHGGLGDRVRLPGRGSVPRWLALGAVALLAAVPTVGLVRGLAAPGPVDREADWAAFGRVMPADARVAASWGDAEVYMFWAPQARYLNVLDPIFMARSFPVAYGVQRAVFAGDEPDVPFALATELDSDHLASARLPMSPKLRARLADDPRIALRHDGLAGLWATVPDANEDFVLDWRVVPRGESLPPARVAEDWPRYPRSEHPEGRRLEGFVEGDRVSDGRCVALVHELEAAEALAERIELAAAGSARLWIDERMVVAVGDGDGAVLGRGAEVHWTAEPGRHRMTVLTCSTRSGGRNGFYLRRR